jgi:hypothetical protein
MDAGQTQAQALTEDQQKEIDKLNLHPRERSILQQVLINSPALTIPEALAMLNEAGM